MATKPKTKRKDAKRRKADLRSRETAIECARIADARRGEEIVVLHIEEKILVTDYFVLVSASNKRQAQAIAADVRQYLKDSGYTDVRIEGYEEASWVLIDCGVVVLHVFQENLRSYYDLELLWGDSPKVAWEAKKK